MKKTDGIISFDLFLGTRITLDISKSYPISELHAIRSTKPLLDTIIKKKYPTLDFSLPLSFSITSLEDLRCFDIAPPMLAEKRGLTLAPEGETPGSTIDLFPPINPPYGALDTRGDPIVSLLRYPDIYRRTLPWALHARRVVRDTSRYLRKRRKPIIFSLCIAVGLTLPILFYTKSLIEQAYGDILSIKDAGSQEQIINLIRASRGNFERANILFSPFRIIPGENVKLARIALDGGLTLSRGLDQVISNVPLTASGKTIEATDTPSDSLYRPKAKDIRPLIELGIEEPTTWMRKNRENLEYFVLALSNAGKIYSQAEGLDNPRAGEIAHIGRGISKASAILEQYFLYEKDILALLGADTPERYIVFNQNRDEIRANGGFPGSVITFTVFRGNIEDYRTDDVYYYDWNLYPFKEIPPPGLALLSNNYGLRDVNYYADFRETLEKANTFIERSGDPTVTVGVALHQGLIEDILGDIRSVSLSGVTESFRADNFSLLMSVLVESRFGEETSAKDILRRFVDAFTAKIHDERAYEEVLSRIENSIKNGEILFASRNGSLDRFLALWRKPLPWEYTGMNTPSPVDSDSPTGTSSGILMTGALSQLTQSNWAYPLLTSLSGNKSDRTIERSYTAESSRASSCTYTNKLVFTHKHNFTKSLETQIRGYMAMIGIADNSIIDKMLAIQGKGKNITYMRILVPKNATLTGSTAGITLAETPYAKEFIFTLDTPVMGTASKTIRYTLDIPECQNANIPITWHRQPGLNRTTFESK